MSAGQQSVEGSKGSMGQLAALSGIRIAREPPGDQATRECEPAGVTPAGRTRSPRQMHCVFTCHADQYREITGNQRAVTWNDAA